MRSVWHQLDIDEESRCSCYYDCKKKISNYHDTAVEEEDAKEKEKESYPTFTFTIFQPLLRSDVRCVYSVCISPDVHPLHEQRSIDCRVRR